MMKRCLIKRLAGIFFVIFLSCTSHGTNRVLINFLIPQATSGFIKKNGNIIHPHISVLSFNDTDDVIAKNFGKFLLYLNRKMEGIRSVLNPIFVGTEVNRHPSQYTGDLYYVLEGVPAVNKKNFDLVPRLLEGYILEFYAKNIAEAKEHDPENAGSLEDVSGDDLGLEVSKGYPHLSLGKNKEPHPGLITALQGQEIPMAGFQVIYSFDFEEFSKIKIPQIFTEKYFDQPGFVITQQFMPNVTKHYLAPYESFWRRPRPIFPCHRPAIAPCIELFSISVPDAKAIAASISQNAAGPAAAAASTKRTLSESNQAATPADLLSEPAVSSDSHSKMSRQTFERAPSLGSENIPVGVPVGADG